MSTLEATFGQLPEPILNKLESMVRRVRRLLLLRGLFATLAVGLACLLAIMAIDATITLFSTTSRWVLSLAGLAITTVAAWWFLVRPLSRRFTLTHMARILEIRHPELQERISTAVELLSSEDPESIKGSEELIAAVVDSAVDDVETVDPRTEFKPARANKFIVAALVMAGIIALTLVIWPKQSWTLLARALAPFLDIGNAYADSLVIDPGDVRVAKGDPVTIEMSVKHKRLKRAEIRRLLADGTESVERMTLIGEEADGTKRFSLTFPSVEEDFDYRVRAGAALSRYFDVDAVTPPTVEQLSIRYDYPDYTGLETTEKVTETGEIRAIAHTAVTLRARINKPVQSSKLIINDGRDLGAPEVEGNELTWYLELLPGMSGNWHLQLSDLDGFSNTPLSYPLDVLPDKAPIVQIQEPALRELRLRPTERLQIAAEVVEDFGVSESALLITPDRAPETIVRPQSLPTGSGRPGSYAAAAVLDLPSLDLEENQNRLSVQLQVKDNRPPDYDGPGIGVSETLIIHIDRNAKSLADQAIEKQRKEVRENLREAKEELQRARDDMRRVEQEVNRDEEINSKAREELKEFSERTEAARDKLDEVAAALNDSIFQEEADKAREVANETIAEARDKADLVPVTDGKKERAEEARESRQKVEEAIREVDELAKAMDKAEEDYRTISEFNELANRQQELAMRAEEMADRANQRQEAQQENQRADSREMQQFQSQQQQIQNKLSEMLKDNAAALDEILEQQQAQAEQMAQAASELAEEQQQLREMSEEATKANEAKQEALREQLLAHLQQEQQKLAEQTGQKADATAAEESAANQENGASEEAPNAEQSQAMANAESDPAANQPSSPEGSESPENSPTGQEAPAETQQASNTDSPTENTPSETTAENSPSESQQGESPEGHPSEGEPSQPTPADQLASAAEQAAEAARNLAEENLDAASEAASDAGDTLAEAAAQTPGETAGESSAAESGEESSSPEMASTSAESAEASSEAGEPSSAQEAGQPQTAEAGGATSPENGSPTGESGEPGQPLPTNAELAERQQSLAEQIEAVRDGDLQEALALMESQLNNEAAALQSEAQAFEQAMRNLEQRSAQSGADRAEQALNRGAQKAGDASRQLADAQQQQSRAEEQGRVEQGELSPDAQSTMQRSQNEQRQSENYLSQAAQALGQTSEAIGRTMEGLEPSESDERIADSGDLAKGFEEVSEASQSQNAQQAAQQSQQAADALQQIAQSAMQKLGSQANQPPGQPGAEMPPVPPELTGDAQSENLNETGEKMADADGSGVPPELERLGISVEDWARFRGALVGGSATSIETELPAEYRELVGRYFQVIAKEAGKDK